MAQAVTAALNARLGTGLRPIVLKTETLFVRNVGLALIIRIPREWKPAKGMLLNFKEKDPICPGLQLVTRMLYSISITKCPLALVL